jgi:hypothetical protein
MHVEKLNLITGETNSMELEVTQEQMDEYNLPGYQRRNVQTIFPLLSIKEREFLLTGMTVKEQDDFYDGLEEED